MNRLRLITFVISYTLLALYLGATISTVYFIVALKKKDDDMNKAMNRSQNSFLPPLICIISSCSVLMTVILIIGVHKEINEFIVFWLFYCISNTLILLALYICELVVITDVDVLSTSIQWIALILQILFFYIIYKYYKEVKRQNPPQY